MNGSTEFVVEQAAFSGSVAELAHALRSGSLDPSELDLYQLVRAYLEHLQAFAADLELATEALPKVAQVIELKLRLLLPKPPRLDDEAQANEELDRALEAVMLLEDLEDAIAFLRRRRSERRLVLPARTERPAYPRAQRPIRTSPDTLAHLAAARRAAGYFEVAFERVSLKVMMRDLLIAVRRRLSGRLFDLLDVRGWPERTVAFTALLELVKDGKLAARQDAAFGPIEVSLTAAGEIEQLEETAVSDGVASAA